LAKWRTSPNSAQIATAAGPTDPVPPHERLAARLGSCDAGQLRVEQVKLGVEAVDHPQGQVNRLAGHRRELDPGQPCPPVGGEQLGAVGQPVVEQDRMDALVPGGPLTHQGTTQADLGTRIGDVRRWHPRLRQRASAQQLPQVVGVGAVGLGAPLGATQRAGVGRLGQVRAEPGALQFLGDEPPAGGGLQREPARLGVELLQPGAQLQAGGGAELPTAGLAGGGVEDVEGDLAAVDVQPSYDGHRDLLWLPRYEPGAASVPHRAEGGPAHMPSIDVKQP
jgi:hypothetical protein